MLANNRCVSYGNAHAAPAATRNQFNSKQFESSATVRHAYTSVRFRDPFSHDRAIAACIRFHTATESDS